MDYQVNVEDLLTAWELHIQKLMNLLECTLVLRLEIKKAMPDRECSDEIFIDCLESNLIQLKALTTKE